MSDQYEDLVDANGEVVGRAYYNTPATGWKEVTLDIKSDNTGEWKPVTLGGLTSAATGVTTSKFERAIQIANQVEGEVYYSYEKARWEIKDAAGNVTHYFTEALNPAVMPWTEQSKPQPTKPQEPLPIKHTRKYDFDK